jgi:phosphoglycerol transferase
MKDYLSRLPRPSFGLAALSVLALAFLYMTLRNMGIYPSIFGDEWTYSSAARLEPFSAAIIPNYLYYSAYAVTGQCGTASLECARSLNALFYIAAAPFIYLIARQLASRPVAAVVALLSVLRPANSYTAYFMPEAMYYAGFWLLTWTCFNYLRRPSALAMFGSALVLGLLTMVKVHALFLLPPWVVFMVYASWSASRMSPDARPRSLLRGLASLAAAPRAADGTGLLLRSLGWLAAALLAAAIVRFGLGYLFAGKSGLHLLGVMYSGQSQGKPALMSVIPTALQNLEGHMLGIVLMLGLPFAALLLGVSPALRRTPQQRTLAAMGVYTVLMFGALLAITTLFTASVAGHGAESNARLHMRYYDFVLPLLLLIAAGHTAPAPEPWSSRPAQEPSFIARLLAAAPAVAVALYGATYLLPAFAPSYIDSPELFGMTRDPQILDLLATGSLACLLLWTVSRRWGALLFLFIYGPLFAALAGAQLNERVRWAQQSDPYVRAGLFAREYLSPGEINNLTLVGRDAGDLFKTRMLIDNPKVKLIVQPHETDIDPASLGGPRSYVLTIGNYRAPAGSDSLVHRREFSLLRLRAEEDRNVVRFDRPEHEWGTSYVQGLSGPEPWGRWSDKREVVLEFASPLPAAFSLRLDAAAFGPNVGKPFVVRLGKQERTITLPEKHGEVVIDFDGEAGQVMTIEVPQPTSPRDIGAGDDARTLGIALYRMQIEPRPFSRSAGTARTADQ